MATKKVSSQKFRGNNPNEHYTRLGVTEIVYGTTWSIWEMKNANGYDALKITADKPISIKANYWFGRNQSNSKFAKSRDLGIMAENRPDLLDEIIYFFSSDVGGQNRAPQPRIPEIVCERTEP